MHKKLSRGWTCRSTVGSYGFERKREGATVSPRHGGANTPPPSESGVRDPGSGIPGIRAQSASPVAPSPRPCRPQPNQQGSAFPPAPHRGRHAKSQSSPRYGAPSSPFVPSRQRCDRTAGSRTCPGRRRRLAAWTLGRDGGPPEEEGQRPHVARLKGCARWAACRRVCTHSGQAVLRPPGRQRPVLRRWGPFQRGLWCSSPGRFRQNGASRASLAP